jgi:hypothetical protein
MKRLKNKILDASENLFDFLKKTWESHTTNRLVSFVLVVVFIITSIISYTDRKNIIDFGNYEEYFSDPFFAIQISFTLLLLVELLSLIFMLHKSVSKSVGKQFELLSLIFIRFGFKEFGHIESFKWNEMSNYVYHMFAYAFGALAIFIILGIIEKIRKHLPLTDIEDEQKEFIRVKKLLSLFLLLAFLIVGTKDATFLVETGIYLHSFHSFYNILIFSDILIVFIALRYTHNYYILFRYSAFVLATIFIRIALSLESYASIIVGVASAIFVLLLTFAYNYFVRDLPEKKLL